MVRVVLVLTVLTIICSGCSIGQLLAGKPKPVTNVPNGTTESASGQVAKQVVRFAWLAVPAIVGGIILAGMGIVKPGLTLAGGGSVLLAVSMAVVKYAVYIEYAGAVIIFGLCVVLIVSKTKILGTYQTAFGEVVRGVEAVKEKLAPEGSMRAAANAILAGVQSEVTQKLVKVTKG